MYNTKIPRRHFLAADYPLMEDGILGSVIPLGWGIIEDIVPFCIDTEELRFKVVDQPVQAITAVKSKGVLLSSGSYTADLALGEFILQGTPYVVNGYTYYFSISADYAINGTDYLQPLLQADLNSNQAYTIDGSDVWTPISGRQLLFMVYGKSTLDGDEALICNGMSLILSQTGLRDAAARTRIGESFTPITNPRGPGWWVTRIRVMFNSDAGAPAGNLIATMYSAISPEVQKGIQGDAVPIVPDQFSRELTFPQDGAESDLLVDIESPDPVLSNGADVLEYVMTEDYPRGLGKSSALLEPVSLANFRAKKMQEINPYLDREMDFGEFLGKLEATLIMKFVPLQTHPATYGTIVYEAGEPAGVLHFRDEDFPEGTPFRIEHDLSPVRNLVRVKYDESPDGQRFKVAEKRSDYARLFYSCEETIEIETWLKQDLDAQSAADEYSFYLDRPEVRLVFEVHGSALGLIPGRDKVKITKSRAAWAGGSINGELFRVVKIVKRPAANSAELTVVPDARTYPPAPPAPSASIPASGTSYDTELYYGHNNSGYIGGVDLADFATEIAFVANGVGSGDGYLNGARAFVLDPPYCYVADDINNRIQKFLLADGSFVSKSAAGVVSRPWGMCLYDGKIYVVEYVSHKIAIIDADTLTRLGEFGEYGTGNDGVWSARGISTDGEFLYICDFTQCRIKVTTLNGTFVDHFGGGYPGGSGNGEVDHPYVCEPDGNYLYVADFYNNRVEIFNRSDRSYAGQFSMQFSNGNYSRPTCITFDEDYIYVGVIHTTDGAWIEKYDKTTHAYIGKYNPDPDVFGGIPLSQIYCAYVWKDI